MKFKIWLTILIGVYQSTVVCSQIIDPNPSSSALASFIEPNMSKGSVPFENGLTYPLIIKAKYGHQFYLERRWKTGTIHYQDDYYSGLELMYDLISQEVIIKNQYRSTDGIIIDLRYLNAFSIDSDHFISLKTDSGKNFYQLLLDGDHFQLLARHLKILVLKPDGYKVEYIKQYYALKNGELLALKTKHSLNQIAPNALQKCKQIKSSEAKWSLRKENLLINLLTKLDHEL